MPPNNSLSSRKPKTTTGKLRSKKRIENALDGLLIHTDARIVDLKRHILAGQNFAGSRNLGQIVFVNMLETRGYEDVSESSHGNGFSRVDHQVHDELLDLRTIAFDTR